MEERGVSREEMESVFNMGWGMFIVAHEEDKDKIMSTIGGSVIGRVI
jgi:phosphoribosylaminoimidazole (AIR) synthetase